MDVLQTNPYAAVPVPWVRANLPDMAFHEELLAHRARVQEIQRQMIDYGEVRRMLLMMLSGNVPQELVDGKGAALDTRA